MSSSSNTGLGTSRRCENLVPDCDTNIERKSPTINNLSNKIGTTDNINPHSITEHHQDAIIIKPKPNPFLDENVLKFVVGDIIIDKENPFKEISEAGFSNSVEDLMTGNKSSNMNYKKVSNVNAEKNIQHGQISIKHDQQLKSSLKHGIELNSVINTIDKQKELNINNLIKVPDLENNGMDLLSDVSDAETASSIDFVYYSPAATKNAKIQPEAKIYTKQHSGCETDELKEIPNDKTNLKRGGLRKIFPAIFSNLTTRSKSNSLERKDTPSNKGDKDVQKHNIKPIKSYVEGKESHRERKSKISKPSNVSESHQNKDIPAKDANGEIKLKKSVSTPKTPNKSIISSNSESSKSAKPKPPERQDSLRNQPGNPNIDIRQKDTSQKNGRESAPTIKKENYIAWTNPWDKYKISLVEDNGSKADSDFILNDDIHIKSIFDDSSKQLTKIHTRPSLSSYNNEVKPTKSDVFFHDNIKPTKVEASKDISPVMLRDSKPKLNISPAKNNIKSVGAKMTISSTNVMISPKKESEVSQRKQMHASNISPNNYQVFGSSITENNKTGNLSDYKMSKKLPEKFYSPPESPIPNSKVHLPLTSTVTAKIKENHKSSDKASTVMPFEHQQHENDARKQPFYVQQTYRGDLQKKSVDSIFELEYSEVPDSFVERNSAAPSVSINSSNSRPITPTAQNIIDLQYPPQKLINLQNIEEFYWNQINKIKIKQENEILQQAMRDSDVPPKSRSSINDALLYELDFRSRSASPGYRGLSLPRQPKSNYAYPAPKNVLTRVGVDKSDTKGSNHQNFSRNMFHRRTVGSTDQRHIKEFEDFVEFDYSHHPAENHPVRSQSALDNFITAYRASHELDDSVVLRHPQKHYDFAHKRSINQLDHSLTPNQNVKAKLTPIFKRGSLVSNPQEESTLKDKSVSFSNSSKKNDYQNLYELLRKSTPTLTRNESHYGYANNIYAKPIPKEPVRNIKDLNNIYGKIVKRGYMVNRSKVEDQSGLGGTSPKTDYSTERLFAAPAPRGSKYFSPISSSRGTASIAGKGLLQRRVSASSNAKLPSRAWSEYDGGSEASEIQRILLTPDQNAMLKSVSDGGGSESGRGSLGGGEPVAAARSSRSARRDDPRRHTLGGDHLYQPQQALQQQPGIMRTMDLQPPLPRGYPPPSSAMLFDDDPGIMSEVETASTGFRRGGKQRSSLPVVRTPSKTLERPLGLVFLQYRNETKRALLPNEITSIDTVKALFVRSFPKQLSMEYLDSPLVKIYIHDSSKDMFYELEDLRSHLRDIRDRSVLRLFESADVSGGAFPGSLGNVTGLAPGLSSVSGPPSWDQDQSYFSEPEFDSDYHHQHIHKSKVNAKAAPAYYMGSSVPTTLPRGNPALRAYSPASGHPIPADRVKSLPSGAPPKPLRTYGGPVAGIRGGSERRFPFAPSSVDAIRGPDQLYSLPADRIHSDGYMSSPERGSRGPYEEPYYTQYVGPQARGGMTPVIDEESSEASLLDEQYGLYGVKPPGPRAARGPGYETGRINSHAVNDELVQRIRVEHMERQLANLTGLVAKALQTPGVAPPGANPPLGGEFIGPGYGVRSSTSAQDKSVSFEKSVSFSDEPPDMNSPKQHSPQHPTDTKPPKPAIKSSTLPRTSSQERDRLKPAPPPKPATLIGPQLSITGPQMLPPMIGMPIEIYDQLKMLHKKCKDLRMEMRNLRRMTVAQVHTMREMICNTFVKIRSVTNAGGAEFCFSEDAMRLVREEEAYKQVILKLESDLTDLETTVELLRGNVINRKIRVNMIDVEKMALVLSKSSKTVADLKLRFPILQDGMKVILSNEMEKVVRDEKFLKEEPIRLEMALKRCKKLTGTLVTLKRLASVQEQRLPCAEGLGGRDSPDDDSAGIDNDDSIDHDNNAASTQTRSKALGGGVEQFDVGGESSSDSQRPENALDALLDELQTFARPGSSGSTSDSGSYKRLHSYPSNSDLNNLPPVKPRGQSSTCNKPPVPERHPELLVLAARRPPPPPPPRTTSRSPLASPLTSPASPAQANHRHQNTQGLTLNPILSASNSSSCESVNSQEGISRSKGNNPRHELLEQRHQELLKKQKALQDQYARLQMIQKGNNSTNLDKPDLKKTGSESNLLNKMGMNTMHAASGSLTHLASTNHKKTSEHVSESKEIQVSPTSNEYNPNEIHGTSTVNKVYETDIL